MEISKNEESQNTPSPENEKVSELDGNFKTEESQNNPPPPPPPKMKKNSRSIQNAFTSFKFPFEGLQN